MPEQSPEAAITAWLDGLGALPPLLTAAQEIQLGRSIRTWRDHPDPCPAAIERRGIRARNRLVAANLRLVPAFYRKWGRRFNVPVADALQNGSIGLMRAADKFDPERGYKFSTYAALWIRQAFQRAGAADALVRVPCDVANSLAGIDKTRDPVTADRIADAARFRCVLSLDAPIANGSSSSRSEHSLLSEVVAGGVLEVEQLAAGLALEELEQALGGDDLALLVLREESAGPGLGELAELVGCSPRNLSNQIAALRRRGRRVAAVAAALAA